MADEGFTTAPIITPSGVLTPTMPAKPGAAPAQEVILGRPLPAPAGHRFHIVFIFLLDLLVLAAATTAALMIRSRIGAHLFRDDDRTVSLLAPIALLVVPVWLLTIAAFGCYQRKQLGSGTTEYRRTLNASLLTAALAGISAYLLQYPMSRAFYFLMFTIGIPLVLVERYCTRRFLHRARQHGRFRSRVLLAGDCAHIDDLLTVLGRESWLGYDPVGVVSHDPACSALALPTIDTPDNIVHAVRSAKVDVVIFTEGAYLLGRDFNRLARELEHERTELIVVPSLSDMAAARMTVRPAGGIPLVHIEKPQAEQAGTWLKRTFDIVGSLLLIVLSSPIMAAAAAAIKLDDHGPVFFKQRRVGVKGEIFECFKLRSMVTDAEQIKKTMLMGRNESDGVLFKIKSDPRVTKVGRFLRKYSIDELPQFFNVLKGDMSLVGPRPALQNEVDHYEMHVRRRLDVRPGVTGLWQVSGRSDLSWEDSVRLDLFYVDNWSMIQDLTILMRTLKAIFTSSGAY